MAIDSIPELAAQRCGEEIARLRALRRWPRAKLIVRLYDALDPDDPAIDHISEAWLKRLENGLMVKVPRSIVEALCSALRCSRQERARVLLYADRNVFGGDNAPDAVAEALAYAMDRMYTEAHAVLASIIGQRHAAELDEAELFELIATAQELVMKRHWRSRSNA